LKSQNRPTWDELFLLLAENISLRGTCNSRNVGCVIARDNHIVSGGYNGSPSGLKHCTEVGCQEDALGRCQRAVHAEQNAVIHAGGSVRGCTAYVTRFPCSSCSLILIAAGISWVIVRDILPLQAVRELHARNLFHESGVMVRYTSDGVNWYTV
jgi:dCMP deaminase